MYPPVVLQDAKCILRWCVARYFGQNWVHMNSMLSLAWPNNDCQWRRMFSYLNDNRFLVPVIVFLMLTNGNWQLHLHKGVLRKKVTLIWYSSIHFNIHISIIIGLIVKHVKSVKWDWLNLYTTIWIFLGSRLSQKTWKFIHQ